MVHKSKVENLMKLLLDNDDGSTLGDWLNIERNYLHLEEDNSPCKALKL